MSARASTLITHPHNPLPPQALTDADLIHADTLSTEMALGIGTHHLGKTSGKKPVTAIGLVMSAASSKNALTREAPTDTSEESLLSVTVYAHGTSPPAGRTDEHKALLKHEKNFEKLEGKTAPAGRKAAMRAALKMPVVQCWRNDDKMESDDESDDELALADSDSDSD